MRTLDEITAAVRRNDPVTDEELRYSVCAYDVLLALLELDKDPVRLKQYMTAGDMCPREYIGHANDPNEPSVQEWHKAFLSVGEYPGENDTSQKGDGTAWDESKPFK